MDPASLPARMRWEVMKAGKDDNIGENPQYCEGATVEWVDSLGAPGVIHDVLEWTHYAVTFAIREIKFSTLTNRKLKCGDGVGIIPELRRSLPEDCTVSDLSCV